jgi:hypothetical protein
MIGMFREVAYLILEILEVDIRPLHVRLQLRQPRLTIFLLPFCCELFRHLIMIRQSKLRGEGPFFKLRVLARSLLPAP